MNMRKKGLGMITKIACGSCFLLLTGFSVLGEWDNMLIKETYQFEAKSLTGY